MKKFSYLFLFCIMQTSAAFSATPTPVGFWTSYDLDGVARSVVQIYIEENTLKGKIQKNLVGKNDPLDLGRCSQCKGKLKDKPIKELDIIWDLKKNGNAWLEGHILDTDSGNIYDCNIHVSENNQILYLHAYKGLPILGKTINWRRIR